MNNLACGQMIHHAIVFAAKAHKGQVRKGTDLDYLSHLMEVLQILAGMDASMDLLQAGILHDVIEDTPVTEAEVREKFGDAICDLVLLHTDDKKDTWQDRKECSLKKALEGGRDSKLLMLADRLSNARSMYMDAEEVGEALWERFNAPKDKQQWYMCETLKVLESLKMDTLAGRYYRELDELYHGLFD